MNWRLLHPKYWPTWIGLALLRAFEPLPHRWLMALGALLGRLIGSLPIGFRRVARRNIDLCLPELPQETRRRILREHFADVGRAVFETAMSWWSPNERIVALTRIEGLERVERAMAEGRGVVLLAAHFTTLEIGCRALAARLPLNVMYRPTKNEALTSVLTRQRGLQTRRAIPRDDARTLVRALKAGEVAWYAPDQSYRKKGAEMVPFFGIPAASNTATSRIAQMTGAVVMPYFFEREPDGRGYRGFIGEPLADYPGESALADAQRHHRLIEAQIRRRPEQYLWIHKRFKGLSADYPDFYGARPVDFPDALRSR